MHPFVHAASHPDRIATIMAGSGATMTYGELEARSNQVAHLLRANGLKRGDTVVVFMENNLEYLAICWGAQRAGLVYVAMATKLLRPTCVVYGVEPAGANVMQQSLRVGRALSLDRVDTIAER